MGAVIDFPPSDAFCRKGRRPVLPDAYAQAAARFVSCFGHMSSLCYAFISERERAPNYPVDAAVAAVSGVFLETPRFTQAWVRDGRDHRVVVHLVRINHHVAHLRTALEHARAPRFLLPQDIERIHEQLGAAAAYAEGALETPLTSMSAAARR